MSSGTSWSKKAKATNPSEVPKLIRQFVQCDCPIYAVIYPPEQGVLRVIFELLAFSVPYKTIICYLYQDLFLVLNEYFLNVINQVNFRS